MVEFKCPACGQALCVGDEQAGRSLRCPGCQTISQVPEVTELPEAGGGSPARAPTPQPAHQRVEDLPPLPELPDHLTIAAAACASVAPVALLFAVLLGAAASAVYGILPIILVTLPAASAGGTLSGFAWHRAYRDNKPIVWGMTGVIVSASSLFVALVATAIMCSSLKSPS